MTYYQFVITYENINLAHCAFQGFRYSHYHRQTFSLFKRLCIQARPVNAYSWGFIPKTF